MASAANPNLWRDNLLDTPPVQWQAVASDGRWWWSGYSFASFNPIRYIGSRPLPAMLEFDWEILTPPDTPGSLTFHWEIEGVGSGDIALGSSVGTGTISLPTEGYTPGGVVSFYVSSQYDEAAYGGSVAVLGPDIPAAAEVYDINLSWTEGVAGTYPITSYRLYRSIDGAAYELLSTQPGRTYVDPGISDNTVYAYRVYAVDSQGNQSVQSNVVSLERVPADTAPVLSVEPNGGNPDTLDLSWSAAAFGDEQSVSSYEIYRINSFYLDGSFIFTDAPTHGELVFLTSVSGATLAYADTAANDPTNYQNYQYAYYVKAIGSAAGEIDSNIAQTAAPS